MAPCSCLATSGKPALLRNTIHQQQKKSLRANKVVQLKAGFPLGDFIHTEEIFLREKFSMKENIEQGATISNNLIVK